MALLYSPAVQLGGSLWCIVDGLVKPGSWKMLELTLVYEAAMSGVDYVVDVVYAGFLHDAR